MGKGPHGNTVRSVFYRNGQAKFSSILPAGRPLSQKGSNKTLGICKRKTTIGGQAVIEGIMMRGPHVTSLCVRKPDGSIAQETWDTSSGGKPPFYKTTPFLRGIFNMIDTLKLGFRCLMKSADLAEMEEEEPSKFEKWLSKTLGKDLTSIVSTLAILLGIGLAVLLFIVIPTGLSSLLRPYLPPFALSWVEGLVKILIFIAYLFFCSKQKDVNRLFGFHGAEHKTIACYEAMEELTVENCRKYTRFHPRCGTSFLFLVLIISILITSVVTWSNVLVRMVLKLLLLPVVVGVAYEIIKLAGRCDNLFTRVVSAPGLWLQRLTTSEPDDSQLGVAIAAMNLVIPENHQDDQW